MGMSTAMRSASYLMAAAITLGLGLRADPVERAPWDGAEAVRLAEQLVQQTQHLARGLKASTDQAQAATQNPDLEVGVGHRTVLIADLSILESRANAYVSALKGGLGRDQTRSLFGRIDSLVSLTAVDMRSLPDYGRYGESLEALEKTVGALGLFYAEHIEYRTPPDPLKDAERKAP